MGEIDQNQYQSNTDIKLTILQGTSVARSQADPNGEVWIVQSFLPRNYE